MSTLTESVPLKDTNKTNFTHDEPENSQIMSTPVYVKDDIMMWRPASLLNKKSKDTNERSQSEFQVSVNLNPSIPSMQYTLDYHKRVLLPQMVASPYRKKNQSTDPEISDEKLHKQIDLSEYDGGSLPLQDTDDNGNMFVRDNLTDVPYLHEASILYNLAKRNESGNPYTRAGSVLISYNPLRWIKGMYSDEQRAKYSRELVWRPRYSTLSCIQPHLYEVSSLAYRGMSIDGNDQSIVVSGETGAGKTEAVKILMSSRHIRSNKSIVE